MLKRTVFAGILLVGLSVACHAQPVWGPTPLIYPNFLPDATQGTNYGWQFDVDGGTPPYVFSVTGLPAGMSFHNSNAVEIQVVGQCTASSSNVIVTVTDSA